MEIADNIDRSKSANNAFPGSARRKARCVARKTANIFDRITPAS